MGLAAISGLYISASGFKWLGTSEAAIALTIATIIEVCAYYISFLDNLLDTVQVPVVMGIGTVIITAILRHTDPVLQWTLDALTGGRTAGIMKTLANFTLYWGYIMSSRSSAIKPSCNLLSNKIYTMGV